MVSKYFVFVRLVIGFDDLKIYLFIENEDDNKFVIVSKYVLYYVEENFICLLLVCFNIIYYVFYICIYKII